MQGGTTVGITVKPIEIGDAVGIEQIRQSLVTHLVGMQRDNIATEGDDYRGKYLKFGTASGAGKHMPADAWILPSHDEHMQRVATVYAWMPPLLRFGATCLRQAGAQQDDCNFSMLYRQVKRRGLDVSTHHCPPSFVVRGLVGSQPCGAHCDPDRDVLRCLCTSTIPNAIRRRDTHQRRK